MLGASGLLHPYRPPVNAPPPPGCTEMEFAGEAITLRGWRCPSDGPRRGTVVYLHGIADNRASSASLLTRFAKRGFDAIAYDSRAHGRSDGTFCTYGYYEKNDLRRVLDTVQPGPIVLIGTSLGGAVALQHAARDPRVSTVVAAEAFSDLRTVATERAPFVFTPAMIDRAFRRAEAEAHFSVDAVSPMRAARSISAPTLIIHGEADTETPPAHARRIFEALRGPKRLILVPGAGHNESLRGDIWGQIDEWIDTALGAAAR